MKLSDGRILEREAPINWGNPENPMEKKDVEEKFRRNAEHALPPDGIQRIIDAVAHLDEMASPAELISACYD